MLHIGTRHAKQAKPNRFWQIHKRSRLQKLIAISAVFALPSLVWAQAPEHCPAAAVYEFVELGDWVNGITSTYNWDTATGLNFNDQLIRATADGAVPGIVKDVQKDEATGMVTLKLDERCKWSNGERITSADVEAGFELVFNPKTAASIPRDGLFKNGDAVYAGELPISALNIETPDENTVQFETLLGQDALYTTLSMPYYIPLPSEIMQSNPDFAFNSEKPDVFSGPYQVAEYDENYLKLQTNPHYCGQPAFFTEMEVFGAESIAEFIERVAVTENVITVVRNVDEDMFDQLSALDWVETKFYENPYNHFMSVFMQMNAMSGPLADPNLRRAITLALDWDGPTGLDERIAQDPMRSEPSVTLIPSTYLENPPEFQRDLRPRSDRLKDANALLASGGYSEANPLKLSFSYNTEQKQYANLIKAMIEDGLPVKIETTFYEDNAEFYEKVHLVDEAVNDITFAAWGTPIKWPAFYIGFYFHTNSTPSWLTEEGMPFLDTIETSSDPQEVTRASQDALALILAQNIFIPIFLASSPDVLAEGVVTTGQSYADTFWNLKYEDPQQCEG